jgi:hypothetical protein
MLICITSSGKSSELLIESLIKDFLAPYADREMTIDSEELDLIRQIQEADIPVYDLARGLFPYMPVDGAVVAAETLSPPDPSQGMGEGTEALRIDLTDLGLTPDQQAEIERRIMSIIRVKENLHPSNNEYVNGLPKEVYLLQSVDVGGEVVEPEVLDEIPWSTGVNVDDGKKKYWKSKRGKLRLAGKSKARPGETETWLTDDEFSEVQ